MKQPIVIGVAGGTASGKTTVSQKILQAIGPHNLAYLAHDAYYHDLAHLTLAQREAFNFDHPHALETDLLITHLQQLLAFQPVDIPIYDFTLFRRSDHTERIEPRPVILVEGILIFVDEALRSLMQIKVYVDAAPDLRFIRRLRRDNTERGRSIDYVIDQYLASVRPMHLEFVEPSKQYADIIIPRGGNNETAINMVIAHIQRLVADA
ncbi:MAG: uridine kinase [Chloroflexota bacterium]